MAEQWRRDPSDRWVVLDPAGEPKGTVFPTVYVGDELLVDPAVAADTVVSDLERLAREAGWTIEEVPLEGEPGDEQKPPRPSGASRTRRVRLGIGESRETGIVAATPDAWQLLRQARRNDVGAGLSLNHVLSTDPFKANPFKANPFKANPFKANPFKANPFKANAAAVGIDSYASLGFGGRQPVTYVGPAPQGTGADRRPIVAVFDTGLGAHPWFAGDVRVAPALPDGTAIGIDDAATDPETHPALGEPLDGVLDDVAGHGTFIAGLIRQQCADARILPVRVSDGEGFIVENELLGALGRLVVFIEKVAAVDVLNLSFSYYPESPDEPDTVSEMGSLLDRIRDTGCVVVCSAGNEATDRPTFPAALRTSAKAPHVAIGALNPSSRSVALFSNVGDWVTAYAPGVSLVSTIPDTFDGSLQAGMRDDAHSRRRETLDVDDFRGGFAAWSGTSFAAPVVAGRIAQRLVAGDDVARATKAVLHALAEGDRSRV